MYKKLSYEELLKLKSGFFTTLSYILKKSRYSTLKDYLTVSSKQGDCVYHIIKQDYIWRTSFVDGINSVIFFDEREKIELHADKDVLAKIGTLVKDTKRVTAQSKDSESIEQTLLKAFESWILSNIDWKNYLVYDIETSYASNDLRTMDFYLWYAYVVEHGKGTYRYIDNDNLSKFLDFMLQFDGYIIGFNSLAFDNPVTIYNALQSNHIFTEELYDSLLIQLNTKSLDLFQFVRNLTDKRMWLNRLSKSLVGIGKTLESGKEWEWLRKQYHEQWDESALKTLKNYCKNDVKMTYLCLWYILYYKKLSLENKDCVYSIAEFLALSNIQGEEKEDIQNAHQNNMFS
jgi:Predicted 3'-5' exonuclease related to the exonuclease domain of PolB